MKYLRPRLAQLRACARAHKHTRKPWQGRLQAKESCFPKQALIRGDTGECNGAESHRLLALIPATQPTL